MTLTRNDLVFEIDNSGDTNLSLNTLPYTVKSFNDSNSMRWTTGRGSGADGGTSWGGQVDIRTVSMQIVIQTNDPDEYITAKDNLESYLRGNSVKKFTFYKYNGSGGQRYLNNCRLKSIRYDEHDGYLGKGWQPWTPVDISFETDETDWEDGAASSSSGVVMDGPVVIQVQSGTALSIYNEDSAQFVAKLDAEGNLYLYGDAEIGVDSI